MTRLRVLGAVLLATVALVAAACADDEPDDRSSSTTSAGPATTAVSGEAPPTTATAAIGDDPSVELDRVATLDEPVAMAARPGSDLLYVVERAGRVRALAADGDDLVAVGGPVLDLTRTVESGSSEQGMLGLAFSPDGDQLFVDYIERGGEAGTTKVVRYDMTADAVDTSTATELFSLVQPFTNHNGGHLVVGPDEKLYVGLGDGGDQGDPDDHGQDPDTPFAKILRMDLDGANRSTFVSGARNPWRFSFDPDTGDLWIGDVGGSEREEIDHLPGGGPGEPGGSGANLGWSLREGTVDTDKDGDRSGFVDPVYDYSHDDGGCSVVGGFLYRGDAVPGLEGWYVFGDYCQPELRALDPSRPGSPEVIADGIATLTSFGVDGDGELYALSLDGPIYRLVAPS